MDVPSHLTLYNIQFIMDIHTIQYNTILLVSEMKIKSISEGNREYVMRM